MWGLDGVQLPVAARPVMLLASEELRVVQVPGRDVAALPPHLRRD